MNEILDRNLAELLRRYRAVTADPLFRERLATRFVSAALDAARPVAPPVARPAGIPVLRRAALLAAAGLLAVLGAWWIVQGDAAPRSPLEALLAQSDAAVREPPDGAWRAAAGPRIAYAGALLEVATSGRTEIGVDLPALGEVAMRSGIPARVLFEPAGETVRVRVLQGYVELRRAGGALPLPLGSGLDVGPNSSTVLPIPTADAPRPLVPLDEPVAPEPPPVAGEIRGRIAMAGDAASGTSGAPVTDALLILATTDITSEGPKTVTQKLHDPEGRFRWSPPPGRYHFFVQAEGCATHLTRNVVIDRGLMLPDVRVELGPGVSVSGTVLDAASGAPVAGALVLSDSDAPAIMLALDPRHLHDPEQPDIIRARTLTDAEGRFELQHLAAGGQVLRASAPGLAPAWLGLPPGPASDAVLRLGPSGAVEGRVLRDDGSPWADSLMVASFNPPEPGARSMALGIAFTDAEGRYRIESLPTQMGVVLLLGDQPQSTGLPPMRAVQVEAGRTTVVDFGEPRAATGRAELTGFMTEADGALAVGRTLSLSPVSGDPMTDWSGSMVDERGAYHFANLPAGAYDLYAAFGTSGEVSYLLRLELAPGESRRLDLSLAPGGLSGRAAASDGAPLFGANVIVWREVGNDWVFAARALADEQGGWIARSLPPGRYRAGIYDVRGRWAAARLEGLAVHDGLVSGLDTLHEAGGHVAVRVTRRDGTPQAGATVTFRDSRGVAWELVQDMTTGADGVLRLDGVPVGTWQVSAQGGGLSQAGFVEVRATDVAEVTLSLPGS